MLPSPQRMILRIVRIRSNFAMHVTIAVRLRTRKSLSADPLGGSIITPGEISLQNHEQDTIMVWTNDWNFEGPDDSGITHTAHHSLNEAPSGSLESTGAPTMGEDCRPMLYAGFEELLMQEPATGAQLPDHAASVRSPQMSMSLGRQPRGEIDSQCLLECSQMITDLETYIMTDLQAFKIIMGIVKKALEKVSQLVRLQQASSNLRCLLLFTTLMYQILELLEVCVVTVEAERQRQKDSKLGEGPSIFTFGDFSVDAEEQSAFRVQRMLKEVRQGTETINKLRSLAGAELSPSGLTYLVAGQRLEAGDYYSDLEMRFRTLANRLETNM
ncbi:hypothetical protein TruAng_008430 [Truncatella angustata]|nr:hypothetical protein TruAng_008430 [Truncatella angustata]